MGSGTPEGMGTRWRWALPFVFSLLFWASFHPLDLGFLSWVALIPLLVYARATSGVKSFFVAWLAGALAFGAGFLWVRHTVPAGPALLGIYKGIYIALFVLIVRRTGTIWAPAVWVGLEFIRSTLFSGLPWFLLGYTQHATLSVIQIADLGGVWLVSGLVALVNAALVDGRRAVRWAVGGTLAACMVYGVARMETIGVREGPKLSVVQPNIPQSLKLLQHSDREMAIRNYEKHVRLTHEAAREEPDLVVWPEAAIYDGVYFGHDWLPTPWLGRVATPARESGARVLVGLIVSEVGESGKVEGYTNSAVMTDPEAGITARYDKVHLVPFGEYTPFAATIPKIRDIVAECAGFVLPDMRPGTDFPVWDMEGERFGVQICFEGIFPEISRELAGKGAAFSVNISNDGWFLDSSELDQVLAMTRFRALENRIGFVRATNTGISAFVDPLGRVHAMLPGKEVEGTLTARVRLADAFSLYRVTGDWACWLALVLSVVALLRRFFVDRKSKRQ